MFFSYHECFLFKGEGLHLYGSVLTEEGQGNHFPRLENAYSLSLLRSKACLAKQRQTWWEGKKCLPPKAAFFPMAAQHSQLSQDHRPRNADPNWGLGCVWRRKTNWRVKIAVVQGSCAPLIPKVLFSTLHPSHTHRWTHTCTHTNVLTYQHTGRQSSTVKIQRLPSLPEPPLWNW